MRNSVKKAIYTATGMMLLTACLLPASQSVAQTSTVRDGVFTAAQAESGKAVFEGTCKNCHDMKFYQNTLRSWNSQPLLYLWETILGTMPADNPGSLGFDDYTNVLAYILSENGFPAGDAMLDPDHGMDKINIVAP